jgi:diadenosine tetraphosphate (Ap4A) HIT family hydrolase
MEPSPIWEKFDLKNNLIKEYKHWKLLVRKNHVYLGSCVAITNKPYKNLSDLSREEMAEYLEVTKDIEKALKKLWNYDIIHHLLLMYTDKHTHFHIFPRYKELRKFAGIEWIDDFKKNPLGKKNPINQEILNQIRDAIKKEIS